MEFRCSAPRVLLAEDHPDIRLLLTAALRAEGYAVTQFSTGEELVRHLQHLRRDERVPHAIATDVRMPGMCGLHALAMLRAAGCKVPVVVFSAFGDDDAREKAARLGADVFLYKPFDPLLLPDLLACLLELRAQ